MKARVVAGAIARVLWAAQRFSAAIKSLQKSGFSR